MRTPVLINRAGGSAAARNDVAAEAQAAFEAAGIDAQIELIDGGECEVRARAIAERGDPLLVVGGGDGTISAAAGAIAGTSTRLGILPLGTLNHFARDLGIPPALEEAAALIASGAERSVDLAEVNERVFINNSSIGLYPLLVSDREAQQQRLGRRKQVAMAVAAARTLLRFSSKRLRLTVNDRSAVVDTPLLFVGNNVYRLELPGAGTRERLDGGELCVMVLRRKSRWGFFAAVFRSLLGRGRSTDIAVIGDVQHLRVDSPRRALRISLDGETALMQVPLVYRIRPKALTVIAP